MALTISVPRQTVSCRLLDSKLSDDDKSYLAAAVVSKSSNNYTFRNDERLREILHLQPPAAPEVKP